MGAVLGLGLLFVLGLVNVLWPRRWWRIAEGWKYRNPEAVAPSDNAIMVQRFAGGFLCLAAIVIPAWSGSIKHEAEQEQQREETVAEVKATNQQVADRYQQTVMDEARRLGTSPRSLPDAVLEPQGIDHLSAVRRPDFAATGDVAIRVSAGLPSEDWCVTFPDDSNFRGTVDARPCGYERGIITRFAQEGMTRYRATGTALDLPAAQQVANLSTTLLVIRPGRDPRQFTVRLDPIYGGGWSVTFPDTPTGTTKINPSDCPSPLPAR